MISRFGADFMIRSHALPPQAIFTHDETLHAIPLPPLASFLSGLALPEHLVKLNDILNRFRTPKSYHRVEVRLVESSELPPDLSAQLGPSETKTGQSGSDIRNAGEGPITEARRLRWKKERGEPVVLPEGVEMEDWLLQNPRCPLDQLLKGHEAKQPGEDDLGASEADLTGAKVSPDRPADSHNPITASTPFAQPPSIRTDPPCPRAATRSAHT